jgi:GDP-L-fucose synthase
MSILAPKILLTGGHGFLGTKVYGQLLQAGVKPENIYRPTSQELDLRLMENARRAVQDVDIVIHLAARVGGIGFNQEHPGELFYDNAIMGINLIEQARLAGVKKFVQVGTVCAYPKIIPIPFVEEDLWSGYPEETNAPYGLAKKMLLVQLQSYRKQYGFNGIYLLPVNLYGPGDNFNPESSHVIPALIKKFAEAVKSGAGEVTVWGTGTASREFLYADDAARAIVRATEYYNEAEPVNIGSSEEITIKELVEIIGELTGFTGKIVWDSTKPDGQPRRKLDTTKAKEKFAFVSSTPFREGLSKTIDYFKSLRK